jgi:hypothetical protein
MTIVYVTGKLSVSNRATLNVDMGKLDLKNLSDVKVKECQVKI